MEITDLKQMTKEEVFNFIRQRLSFSKELQEQFSVCFEKLESGIHKEPPYLWGR